MSPQYAHKSNALDTGSTTKMTRIHRNCTAQSTHVLGFFSRNGFSKSDISSRSLAGRPLRSIPCVKWKKKLSPPQERQKLL
jgi:hypothetical protein